MGKCNQYYKELLNQYIDKEANQEEIQEIILHMENCDECREEYEMMLSLHEEIFVEDVILPENFHSELMSRLYNEVQEVQESEEKINEVNKKQEETKETVEKANEIQEEKKVTLLHRISKIKRKNLSVAASFVAVFFLSFVGLYTQQFSDNFDKNSSLEMASTAKTDKADKADVTARDATKNETNEVYFSSDDARSVLRNSNQSMKEEKNEVSVEENTYSIAMNEDVVEEKDTIAMEALEEQELKDETFMQEVENKETMALTMAEQPQEEKEESEEKKELKKEAYGEEKKDMPNITIELFLQILIGFLGISLFFLVIAILFIVK